MPETRLIEEYAVNIFEKQCLNNEWYFQPTYKYDKTLGIDYSVIPREYGRDLPDWEFQVQIKGSMDRKKFTRKNARKEQISYQFPRNRLQKWIQRSNMPVMLAVVDIEREVIFWEFFHSICDEIKKILNNTRAREPTIHISSSNIFTRDKDKILWEIQRFKGLKDIIISKLLIETKKDTILKKQNPQPFLISLIQIGTPVTLKRILNLYEHLSEDWRGFIVRSFRFAPTQDIVTEYLVNKLEKETYTLRQLIITYIRDFGSKDQVKRSLQIIQNFNDPRFDGNRNIFLKRIEDG